MAPDTDSQQVYEAWNEDVRAAGAECRTQLQAVCQWYIDNKVKDVTCKLDDQ